MHAIYASAIPITFIMKNWCHFLAYKKYWNKVDRHKSTLIYQYNLQKLLLEVIPFPACNLAIAAKIITLRRVLQEFCKKIEGPIWNISHSEPG